MKKTTFVKYISVRDLVNMYLESIGCLPITLEAYADITDAIERNETVHAIQILRRASVDRPACPFEFLKHCEEHVACKSEFYDFLNEKDVRMNQQTPNLGLKRAKDVVCIMVDLHRQGLLGNTFRIDED